MGESKDRGRRLRGRKKVHYEEVVPSTDLPPLLKGNLRCFLCVDVGKIVWSTTTTAQVPPASPAVVRLRWWGEPAEGTYFKPSPQRSEKVVKSRAKYGVRSDAKQITAYFVDMGSFVFEVMTSPRSVPIGKIQIPRASQLTTETPIRGFFPIISASSRKVGELQLSMHFKPIHSAYDTNTDTDTSVSTRGGSRPPSTIGRRSRSRGSSAGSVRSRSSSRGSLKSKKKKVNRRGRSRSGDSNVSSISSRRSSAARTIGSSEGARITSSTPRGVDEILEQHGNNLYNTENSPPKINSAKKKKKSPKIKRQELIYTENGSNSSNGNQDVISALLNKGKELRNAISKHDTPTSPPQEPNHPILNHQPTQRVASHKDFPTSISPQPIQAKPIYKKQSSNLDLRFVDLMLGPDQPSSFLSQASTPPLLSPANSMMSEFEGNPLHDNNLIEQLFYNNKGTSFLLDQARELRRPVTSSNKENEFPKHQNSQEKNFQPQRTYKIAEKPCEEANHTMLNDEALEELESVECARVLVDTLHLTSLMHEEDTNISGNKNLRSSLRRGKKPPIPSPRKKQGTYFIEYNFPSQDHYVKRTSTVTHDDVTRLVSRKTAQDGCVVIFDQHNVFPLEFDNSTLQQWQNDEIDFNVYYRKSSDKKPNKVGQASIPLRSILQSHNFMFRGNVEIIEDNYNMKRSCGTMQLCIELCGNAKDLSSHFSPPRKTKKSKQQEMLVEKADKVENETILSEESASADETTINEDNQQWFLNLPVFQLLIMVHDGKNIPGTTVYSAESGVTHHPPNVYLVFRSTFSQKKVKTGVIWGHSDPQFQFSQSHPVKISDDTLQNMQNNFMVIEVWTKMATNKKHSDKLIGLVKAPMQLFFQKLCNPEAAKSTVESTYPLIAVDKLLPITDVFTGQNRGQLNLTFACGTQDQINLMKKLKSKLIDNLRVGEHHLEEKVSDDSLPLSTGPVQHTFQVEIGKIHGFKPSDNQVWGETDCFVQYSFPRQQNLTPNEDDDQDNNLELAKMKSYRSETTLCVPDPVFTHVQNHMFCPPLSVPVHRLLMMAAAEAGNPPCNKQSGFMEMGGIPFEVWSRYYYPNVRDQLIAKGWLPIAKLCALVTMTTKKTAEQVFLVPLEHTTPDANNPSAGHIEVKIKYTVSGTTLEGTQPAAPYTKPCILKVAVERACGLKAAAKMLQNHNYNIDNGQIDNGVNCYATIEPSFLPDQDIRKTRTIANTFAPDFQHHIEVSCPVVSYEQDITPISLAELLHSGEISFKFYHSPLQSRQSSKESVVPGLLLGTVSVPLKALLYKTTGLSGWYSIKAPLSVSSHSATVGAVELSVTFTTRNDLDLILRAGCNTGWRLPMNEARLLTSGNSGVIIDRDSNMLDHVTLSITITNAWLPKCDIVLPERQNIDRKANLYARYKFYDADSVVTSLCPLYSSENRSADKTMITARLAHKQSFTCKIIDPFLWYLREEKLPIQLWLTNNSGNRPRPADYDKLLGTCYIDFTELLLSGLSKQQNISGVHELYISGSSDLGGACTRVYVSLSPGVVDSMQDVEVPKNLSENNLNNTQFDETHSSNNECTEFDPKCFMATVTVDRAMHLPFLPNEADESAQPNCYVTFQYVELVKSRYKSHTHVTDIVRESCTPTWTDITECRIPKQNLTGLGMTFKLWHRDKSFMDDGVVDIVLECKQNKGNSTMASDVLIGFATVDLSVLSVGLSDINGWYNILDLHGQCQGQIKLAVTPNSIENVCMIARNLENSEKVDVSKQSAPRFSKSTSNFLHTAPISGPVQTPSGSLYYPGISNSSQTVGITCQMEEHSVNAVMQPPHTIPLFNADQAQPMFLPSSIPQDQGPTRSMIYFNNLDRNQECLFQTLQKQIAELESIKSKFEARRAKGFNDEEVVNEAHEETTQKSETDESIKINSESGNTIHKIDHGKCTLIHSSTTMETGTCTDEKILHIIKPPLQNPADSHKTVHLSLYDQGKPTVNLFDKGCLSDDDLASDIEMIEPQSLNVSSQFDVCVSPRSDLAKPLVFDHETPQKNDEVFKNQPQTPHPSEGHSALEDTSVWMTSTSRISEFSDHEDAKSQVEEIEEINVEEVKQTIDDDVADNETQDSNVEAFQPEEKVATADNFVDVEDQQITREELSQKKEEGLEDRNEPLETNFDKFPGSARSENIASENDAPVDKNPLANENFGSNAPDKQEKENSVSSEEETKGRIPKQVPQFFPPIKNLEAQMLALQTKTTEHKHKLMREKQKSHDNESKNEFATKKLFSPSAAIKQRPFPNNELRFSSEQTQRLQKIFKTKFSNN